MADTNQQEINYAKRVIISLTDIRYCIKYLEKVSVINDEVLIRALHEAIIISYSRPFTGYDKRYHSVKGLKSETTKSFDEHERKTHEHILNRRNTLVGHSDEKSYGVQINISQLFENNAILIPWQRRIPYLLSLEEIIHLKSCCQKIETYLFDEQRRIQNLLKLGVTK